ncbi:PAAR domain-containing protein [Robbsia sp. KACC 23696]|uniref:PAAR domain-containing protein n=1 Tax=Robbsia sp. KACC 23696 TaxID=3149231 RepID=UPI00325B8F07
MVKRYVVHGNDKTTANGTVLVGQIQHTGYNKSTAVEGDAVDCPACKSIGMIVPVGAYNRMRFMNKRVALSDDVCMCKCPTPPRLIASQTTISFSDDASTASAPVAMAATSSTPLSAAPFDMQSITTTGSATQIAARGVSSSEEAECLAQYNIDMDMCSADAAMRGGRAGARSYLACKERAFARYQSCRGY